MFDDIPLNPQTVKHFQRKNSVTILSALSHSGKSPLKFIGKGQKKINVKH